MVCGLNPGRGGPEMRLGLSGWGRRTFRRRGPSVPPYPVMRGSVRRKRQGVITVNGHSPGRASLSRSPGHDVGTTHGPSFIDRLAREEAL